MNGNDMKSNVDIKKKGFVCFCLVFVLMLAGCAGSGNTDADSAGVAGAGSSGEPAGDETARGPWATAGEGFQDLISLINEQQSYGYGSGVIEMAGAGSSEQLSPESDVPVASDMPAAPGDPDAPGGESATSGSGYEYMTPPFPSDSDDAADQNADPVPDSADPSAHGEDDFSDTNEQTEGVREADVLKTDGKYIYAINNKNLWIVETNNGGMTLLSKIPQPASEEGQVYFEMYVSGDRLIAIRHGYNTEALLRDEEGDEFSALPTGAVMSCIAYPISGYIVDTSVDIFDISDRAAPVKLHTLSQSGEYNSSRMIGGYLYLLTTFYGGDPAQMDEEDPRTFVPLYARDGEQYTPDESDIYLPEETSWPSYTVISGIDVTGNGDFVSQKSLYGDAGTIYVSSDAVYLTRSVWEETQEKSGPGDRRIVGYTNWTETVISKLTIGSGHIDPGAQARVPGYVLNQFSLDEFGGALRLVTTNDRSTWYGFEDTNRMYTDRDWAMLPAGKTETMNALYTFNTELEQIGSIGELAPGERVYSCRFMGDIAYFVTFRQTDPLFSVDVSDPANPRVLGALKIPGFSEYLHPYADGRLLGLGRDADAVTGMRQGLKLTMFDNSNPTDVRELHTLAVGGEYSAAEQNHKAILVSADKALIAFPTEERYLVYGYDDTSGFEKIAEISFEGDGWAEIRGLFIGGIFYVVGPNNLNAYSIDDAFAAVGSLAVDEGASSVGRGYYGNPGVIVPFMGE